MDSRFARIQLMVIGIAVSPAASVAVDLNGKWLFGGTEIVTITQTGNSLAIPAGLPLTGTLGPTGTNGFTPYSVSYMDATVTAVLAGRVNPSGNLLDGWGGALPAGGEPFVFGTAATRCTCDDGNTADGDGCDATCQVEPCWTCTGDPSVCMPAEDGAPCDDRKDCTMGETCTAGVCGGGTAVSPCIDMTGLWNRHREIPGLGIVDDLATTITQRGGDVRIGSYVGAIDPATGDLNVRAPNPNLFCAPFDPLIGTVAGDGLTYATSGTVEEPDEFAPDHCDPYAATETGTRCGNGTIDPGEECDDGNLSDGDGCSATCQVEQCWTCAGEPSNCAPEGGGTCDDGDACTSDDTCAGDGSCAGTAVVCEPCLQCDTGLGCIAVPLSPCKGSAQPKKSLLRIKNVADDARDVFYWKWNKGEATALAELGDPPSGGSYAICVYDESGPTTLLFRASMPDSETCDGQSCWNASRGTGFRYRNRDSTPEGVVVTRLKSGDPAKATVNGRGVHLSDRAAGLPSLPLAEQLRVQLQGENGLCLETRHDASTVIKNDPVRGVFKAVGAP